MTHSNPRTINENFKSIKTEGGQRARKVAAIFKGAFAEALAEVKEGGSTVRPYAQALADDAVQAAKEKGQATYASAKQAAQTTAVDEKDVVTRLKLKLQAIVAAIRATLFDSANATPPEVIQPKALVEPAAEEGHPVPSDSPTV